MTDDTTSTYEFDQFTEDVQEEEWERLRVQATILFKKELDALKRCGLEGEQHVLELGCGPGYLSEQLALHTPHTITGLDYSAQFVARAQEQIAPKHSQLSFVQGSITEMPFEDNQFDFAYARLLFQHLPDPSAALSEVLRVLKPGGRLCIMDVDDGWWYIQPSPPSVDALLALAAEGQSRSGGDRRISRRLPALFSDVGFEQVGMECSGVTTLELPLPMFLHITTSFKQHISDSPEAAKHTQAIEAFCAEQEVFGAVGIFFTYGNKPG